MDNDNLNPGVGLLPKPQQSRPIQFTFLLFKQSNGLNAYIRVDRIVAIRFYERDIEVVTDSGSIMVKEMPKEFQNMNRNV